MKALIATAVAALLCFGSAGSSRAATLDQDAFHPIPTFSRSSTRVGPTNGVENLVLQTFSVGISGVFEEVRLQVEVPLQSVPSVPLKVEIATFGPLRTPQTILGTATVDPNQFGTGAFNQPLPFVSAVFGTFNVTSGDTLAIILSAVGSSVRYSPMLGVDDASNPYPAGAPFITLDEGTTFSIQVAGDLGFQTYVTPVTAAVPLPAGGLLLLSGLAGLVVWRRSQA